jgi:hypothetical protein
MSKCASPAAPTKKPPKKINKMLVGIIPMIKE